MFTSYYNNNNNSCDNNMVVVDDYDEQNMFDNRPFENDISPNYKPDNLSFSFFHFSPATTFFDQDDAFLQYHSHLLQQSADSITTATMAAENQTHLQIPLQQQQWQSAVDSPADSITTIMAAENLTQTTKMATASDNNDPFNEPNNKTMKTTNNSTKKTPKRRLAGKKDRHSKIVTAQGPRDRRMRLSLPIAREFFSLQDMLGVDKPSKTVQWLLTMSKSAIEELTISLSQPRKINNKYNSAAAGTGSGSKSTTTGSPMSECEVVSQIEETSVAYNQKNADHDRRSANFSKRKSMESSPSTPTKGKKIKPLRTITCHHPLARESRAKARARARERTIEKKHSPSKQCVRENLNNDLKKVRSLTITSKEGEESAGSGTYDMKSTLELVSTDEVMKHSSPSKEHQGSLVKDTINVVDLEESFMITTRKTSSSSIFSYHGDIGLIDNSNNNNNNSTSVLNFSEMWDVTNNAGQTNFSYCAIADMNLPAGNIQEYCLPSSSSIPLASPNTRLQSQFANLPLFCGKP